MFITAQTQINSIDWNTKIRFVFILRRSFLFVNLQYLKLKLILEFSKFCYCFEIHSLFFFFCLINSRQGTRRYMCIRVWWGPQTFLTTLTNQLPLLPSLSGVHGLKDFLCSDHLLESFMVEFRLKVLKSNFHCKRPYEDGHCRENPSNHELLTVKGVGCRVL